MMLLHLYPVTNTFRYCEVAPAPRRGERMASAEPPSGAGGRWGQSGSINLLNRSLESPAGSGRWRVLGWRRADRKAGVGALPGSHPQPTLLHRLHGRPLLSCPLEGPSLPGLSQCLQGHGELVRRTSKRDPQREEI